jgi:hypothetical protein
MFGVEQLLDFPYATIKQFILNEEPAMLEALKDIRLKEKLINSKSKYDFIWLIQDMSDEYADKLFDDEGINLLIQTPDLLDKMNGILTCGKKYVNKILKKPEFCKIIIDNFDNLKSYLYGLDEKGALALIKYIQENDPTKLKSTLVNLSKTTQEKVVKEVTLPIDVLTFCVVALEPKAAEYLVNNDVRITSLQDYSFNQLYSVFSKEFCLKPTLLEDRLFIKKIVSMSSVKDYRFLINELIKANNVDEIEKLRKDYYTSEMISYNPEFKMLERHCTCYKEICNLIDTDDIDNTKFNEILNKCFNFFGTNRESYTVETKIWKYLIDKDKDGLKEFLINESNIALTNMIVDYHFEDVPYNFFLDVTQLCNFQETEGRTLSDKDLSIYQRLLKLDELSYEEKIKLHHELINEDWISKHYDVFRQAKDKAATLIKEQMLNPSNIDTYLDKTQTEKSGVPIYVLDGQDFFAFVKSISLSKERVIEPSDLRFYVDGSSFSLDGSKKLDTFQDPKEYYNLIYGDFPIDQVIHMYPVDSFTKYLRNSTSKATSRVYELYTPTQFVEKSTDYNEILLAQKNNSKVGDELNDNLKSPTILGIYCYDEITENDIASAKKLGVGIVVVNTKKYELQKEGKLHMMETLSPSFGMRYAQNIDYLSNVNDDDLINRRTK